jgi:hypothetical protein
VDLHQRVDELLGDAGAAASSSSRPGSSVTITSPTQRSMT